MRDVSRETSVRTAACPVDAALRKRARRELVPASVRRRVCRRPCRLCDAEGACWHNVGVSESVGDPDRAG